MHHRPDFTRLLYAPAVLRAVSLASSAALLVWGLTGCGGGDGSAAPAAPATLSGTVAVGAALSDGRLRVLGADGAVVASDVEVGSDGRYSGIPATGPGPWRIEACGYAGADYRCLYAVATAAGTANVTPLTSAAMLLAGDSLPDALMSGAAPATLTSARLDAAQAQLRGSLAALLAAQGLGDSFDFVSGTLDAGSHSGYDGLLDALSVALGKDGAPFVQITPRLGSGNLYLEPDGKPGSLGSGTATAALDLQGLDTLFKNMSAALTSAAACAGPNTGLQAYMASTARLLDDAELISGAAAVAQAMCAHFARGEDGSKPLWGSTLLSPVLEDCELSGDAPVCGVSLALRSPEGEVRAAGEGLGVTREGGVWRFLGDLRPLGLYAGAHAQRTQRVDASAPAQYDRALSFEIEARAGLACARVEQQDADGHMATVAYYKRHPGAANQRRLALWTADGHSARPSLDPASGATRHMDDSWVLLPEGTWGDATIRNFFHGGRRVTISLYADAHCSSPFSVGGRSSFRVPVVGTPPIWSSMETQPWPEVDAAGLAALRALALEPGAGATLSASWHFDHGPLGLRQFYVCGSRGACGEGEGERLGETALRPRELSSTVSVRNAGATPLRADAHKTLVLSGRTGDRVGLQTNYSSCPGTPAGQPCMD